MHNPPKFLLWLLDAFCPPSRQDLKGDFLELYEARVNGYGSKRLGRTQANRQFLWDAITILPLKFIITEKVKSKTQVIMLRTNLKIARRNLAKNKLYTLINVVGLSVSLAACLLITLFVRDELSFDKHFANSEHIYRISGHYDQGGDSRVVSAATSYMLKPLVASNLASSFEQITRLEVTSDLITVNGDQQYSEAEIINVDSTFFDVFAIPFVSGSPATALDDPSSVVLDLPTAEKYFGTENAVGKTIELRGKQFTVSGVIEPIPDNTHFAGHLIFPIAGVKQWYPDWVINNFSGTSLYTYVKFNEKLSVPEFDGQLKQLMAANYPFGTPPDYFLQQLPDIHLKSRLQSEIRANGSETTVYIFSITAIVILTLACINYINLTMAGALQRSKEVGMKKVLGSTARMQISQFQTESILVVLFSGLLAALLAFLFMPLFNELSGKALVFNPFIDLPIGLSILVVVLVIGFVAGSFPAMILLRMSTMGMLSGKVESKNGKSFLRSGLIVFQFAIAITLIASTMIVMDQMRFIRNKDLGINPEEVVLIPLQTYEISQRYELMRERLLNNPGIVGVSASNDNGTTGVSNWREYKIAGAEEGVTCPTEIVAHDFFENMGAQIVEGRTFSRDFQSDYREAYVINEAAVKFFDLDSGVVGTQLQGLAFTGAVWTVLDARIIGVVKNFHMASLHSEVGPVVYSLSSEVTSPPNWMQVRVSSENMSEALESLEDVWVSIAPERPFQYQFMDDELQRQYQAEERFMSIFAAFSILSILLGGLGLFGLTAFMTKRRTKEIGIRKILGASSGKLISLLSIDFLRLVVLANLIGWPIAWYLMEGWLKNFAYQTTISVWVFLGTGLAAVLIAFGAILYHSLKASRVNPVNSLRYQ